MKVRPLEESTFRFVRNSMRAYLEGKKNLGWIAGIIGDSDGAVDVAIRAFGDIKTPTIPQRRVELLGWFQQRLTDKSRA